MKNNRSLFITHAAVIAALYVILTAIAAALGLASGVVQLRLSEALTILPIFTPAAIPGLFIGCFFANLLTGCALWDIIFGSIATLLGAVGTYYLRKHPVFAFSCPIVANTLIIPPVLVSVYGIEQSIWFLFATVGLGELISCIVFGLLIYFPLKKRNIFKL